MSSFRLWACWLFSLLRGGCLRGICKFTTPFCCRFLRKQVRKRPVVAPLVGSLVLQVQVWMPLKQTAWMSNQRRLDKYIMAHSFVPWNTTETFEKRTQTYHINILTVYHSMKNARYKTARISQTQFHILYDSIYMKCPRQTNPQRQKADRWLPGAGGGGMGSSCSMGLGFPLGEKEMLWNLTEIMVAQYCERTRCH